MLRIELVNFPHFLILFTVVVEDVVDVADTNATGNEDDVRATVDASRDAGQADSASGAAGQAASASDEAVGADTADTAGASMVDLTANVSENDAVDDRGPSVPFGKLIGILVTKQN